MSKTYSKLNQINTQRLKERNRLFDNQGKVPLTGRGKDGHQNGQGLLIGALSLFSLLLVIFNVNAFREIHSMTSGDIATARKLASIEALLEMNLRKLDNLSEDVKTSTYKAKVAHEQMTELEKKADGQAFVINNLVKAKDQLISRITKLEQTN
jgi:cellobiose-specific phosphotransferase system component IIA